MKRIHLSISALFLLTSSLASAHILASDPPVKTFILEKSRIVIPDSQIIKDNKAFDFNWKNYSVSNIDKNKVTDIESYLKTIDPRKPLSADDKNALGTLLFKLGAYYSHVEQNPDLAIQKFNQVNNFLTARNEQSNLHTQLAYAYAEKYSKSRNPQDKQLALDHANKTIHYQTSSRHDYNIGLAYTAQAIVRFNDDEQTPTYSTQTVAQLEQLDKYWQSNADYNKNPYAARNLLALGRAYLRADNSRQANQDLLKAVAIFEKCYGNKSNRLVEPYELLADSYAQLFDDQQAEFYLQKAYLLDN